MTAYFISVPANKLELWMWMESERLLRPVFREFYAERDVVFEERRMRTESTPTGKFAEQFNALFWDAHPYHWPVIGWPSDIPAISKKQADEFYALYYQPQNLTLILVGDFKADAALPMAERYFGRIPRGTESPPEVTTLEIPSLGEKRYHAEAETNPQVDILWRTVGFAHKDSYALDVVQQLLLGRTGRLHKGLVLGAQVATDVSAEQDSRKWAGFFEISVEVKDGHTPDEVEKAIEREVDGLKNEEVPVEELQKVKNNFAAAEYRKLSANTPILFQLIFNEGLGDWREVNTAGAKIQAVTAADVKRVMGRYFTKENRAVAIYTRKAGTGASAVDDPEMAGLSPEQKPVARQISAAIAAEKDAAGLKAQLSKIEAALGAADPKKQPLQRFMIRKITARLADLEKR
jgi:predicted Zn-dependent peptidase